MIDKFKVITLCGSIKFIEEFEKVQMELSLQGNMVFSVNYFSNFENQKLTEEDKKILADVHKRKIFLSDEIFVINKDGYIGKSTKREIEYAQSLNKKVNYLESVK